MSAANAFRPLETRLLVRFVPTAEKTKAGIYLPEQMQENWQHCQVIAAGLGLPTEAGRSVMWCDDPGAEILIRRHHFQHVPGDGKVGIVRDEDVLAVIEYDEEGRERIRPANGYLLLEPGRSERQSAGGVLFAEGGAPQARWGTVLDVGPGTLRLSGPLRGTRRSVRQEMGLPESCQFEGAVVYFSREAKALAVGRERAGYWLVAASDLVAIDWPD